MRIKPLMIDIYSIKKLIPICVLAYEKLGHTLKTTISLKKGSKLFWNSYVLEGS